MKHELFFKVKSISNNEAISDLHRNLKCGVTVALGIILNGYLGNTIVTPVIVV